jgi:hypothetical protein
VYCRYCNQLKGKGHDVRVLAYLNQVLSIVPSVRRIAVTWTCDQLHWFSLIIIIFIDIRTPWERVNWLSFRLLLCLFSVRLLACPELFSNSHLSVVRECSPWVWPLLTWTSLPPGYHKNHLIWVDSSLIVFWLSFEIHGLRQQGSAPPPPHWSSWEPSNLSRLDQGDPPWICAVCPLSA